MRVEVQWRPEQWDSLEALAKTFAARAETMGVALRHVVNAYLEEQRRAFDAAGPPGDPWAPATSGSLAAKDRGPHAGEPLLVGKGALRTSVTHRRGAGSGAASFSGATEAFMGSRSPHAHLHALGTRERVQRTTGRRTGALPRRRVALPPRHFDAYAYDVLETYLATGELVPFGSPGGHSESGGSMDRPLVDLDAL